MVVSSDLFLDCILYIINENTDASQKTVKDLIALFEDDTRRSSAQDDDTTRFYIRILRAIIEEGVSKDTPDQLRMILLKFQSDAALSKRGEIYQLLHETFTSVDKLPVDKLQQFSQRMQNTMLWHHCNKITKGMYATLARVADLVDPELQSIELKKIVASAASVEQAYATSQTTTTGPSASMVERIDFTDKDSLQKALHRKNLRSVTGVIRPGLHGLLRMTGEHQGFVRGESVVFYANPHNYKSSLIVSQIAWTALYNVRAMSGTSASKRPLVYLVSLENEAHQNFVWMYRHFYEQTTRTSSKTKTDEEVITWTHQTFTAMGYTVIIERHLPFRFTFQVFVNAIENFKRDGFEVVLAGVDYLVLANKELPHNNGSSDGGGLHKAIQALFSAFVNYCKSEGITLITAHPLNRTAIDKAASGVSNVVKRFDTSMIADSIDVTREVDLEIFLHIQKNLEGVWYLTMMRGKHRYVDNTPEAHKYCAYRFHKDYGIIDDIMGAPQFVTDIYTDPVTDDAETGEVNQARESDPIEEAMF